MAEVAKGWRDGASSPIVERLRRFREQLDHDLPLSTSVAEEYRRLTGEGCATTSDPHQEGQGRPGLDITSRDDTEDPEKAAANRPPDDGEFTFSDWSQGLLTNPRPEALQLTSARPLWKQREAGRCTASRSTQDHDPPIEEQGTNESTHQAAMATQVAVMPAIEYWSSVPAPEEHAAQLRPQPQGTSSVEQLERLAPAATSQLLEAQSRQLEVTKRSIKASMSRRPPAFSSSLADITDPSSSVQPSNPFDDIVRRQAPALQCNSTSRQYPPLAFQGAAAVTPAAFRTDVSDLTAITTPGDDKDGNSCTSEEDEGEGEAAGPRRNGRSPSVRGRAAGGKRAAAPPATRSMLALGPRPTMARAIGVAPEPAAKPQDEAAAAMEESMTASESATDDEEVVMPPQRPAKIVRPDAAAHAKQARVEGNRGIAPSARTASVSTSAEPSLLSAALQEEERASADRRSQAGAARIDKLREQEKRIRRQQNKDDRRPKASIDPASASLRPLPPGPALTTTKPRRSIPNKKPNWRSYRACVRQWTHWDEVEKRIIPQQSSRRQRPVFEGMRILLITNPGLDNDADGSSDHEGEGTNGGWSRDMARWVERVWENGGRCVEGYVEGETTHLVAVGLPRPPEAATCAGLLRLGGAGLAALRGVKCVTQDWARASIAQGRAMEEADERWKLG